MSNKIFGLILIVIALVVGIDTADATLKLGMNWQRGVLLLVVVFIAARGFYRIFSHHSR